MYVVTYCHYSVMVDFMCRLDCYCWAAQDWASINVQPGKIPSQFQVFVGCQTESSSLPSSSQMPPLLSWLCVSCKGNSKKSSLPAKWKLQYCDNHCPLLSSKTKYKFLGICCSGSHSWYQNMCYLLLYNKLPKTQKIRNTFLSLFRWSGVGMWITNSALS